MNEERPWKPLQEALDHGDDQDVVRALDDIAVHDLARTFAKLESDDSAHVLDVLSHAQAADVLEHIPGAQAADLIEHFSPADAVDILEELSVREQADLVALVEKKEAVEILDAMDESKAGAIRDLVSRPVGTAGAILEPEVLAFDEAMTVAEVVAQLQQNAHTYREYQVLYVHATAKGRLSGVVSARDLLLSQPEVTLKAIRAPKLVALPVTADLDEVEGAFENHAFIGLPVVDEDGRLLGVVRRSAMEHAVAERSESDYRKSQGILGGEELRSMPFAVRSRRRLSWLSINIVLNVIAASVIAAYQETLSAVIALAAFLPIISDMSGCSGSQAVAVSMRELALGVASPSDVWAVWRKEASVGVINGIALGALLGGVAFLWQSNVYLSLVVGLALAINTVVAVSLGGVVPLVLKRLHVDPAVASGPILTTVTDLCGFLLTLSLATAWLSRIAT